MLDGQTEQRHELTHFSSIQRNSFEIKSIPMAFSFEILHIFAVLIRPTSTY